MTTPVLRTARLWRSSLLILALLGWQIALAPWAVAQTDPTINQSVWQMLFGVTNAQITSPTWLAADADGDGVSNVRELIAGTNPFQSSSLLQVSMVTLIGSDASVTFPTVAGKLYTVQGSASLNPVNWQTVAGAALSGDGTIRSLAVPLTSGPFFRVVVQDQSTAGDQVSDWAKLVLGYSTTSPISSQSQYTASTLASALAAQNVVTVVATNSATTQPADAISTVSTLGIITFNRSGYQLFSAITVPIAKTGTAVEGTDYASLPNSVTFAPGVNSVSLNITPLCNPTRAGSTTLTITAQPGGGYSLGTTISGSVTVYPASAATGTGLTGQYYAGAYGSYTDGNYLGYTAGTYSYALTQNNSTRGSIVVTYSGAPAAPYTVGQSVLLFFADGNLSQDSEFYANYAISAVGPNTFTVPIAINGVSLAASGTGNVLFAPFAARSNASNFGGIGLEPNAVTYTYSRINSTTGTATIFYSGTPAVAFAAGSQASLQFATGTLSAGTYDQTYTISGTPAFNSAGAGSGSFTVAITGTAVPGDQTTAARAALAPFFAPIVTRVDPTVDFSYGGGSPAPGVPPSNFTVRWTGQVLPQYTEPYVFTVNSADGAQLWVNGQLVINYWQAQAATENASLPVNLQAGVFYDIKLEYLHLTGNGEVHLNWYSADQAEQIIPTKRLFPAVTGTANAAPPGVTSTASDIYVLGSGTPYSYTIHGSNGPLTYSASGLPAGLTLNGNIISGTPAAPGNYQFIVAATNAAGSSSLVVNLNVISTPGQITREIWRGLPGPNTSDIPLLTTPPNTTDTSLTTLEDTAVYPNNTGERLRGYFTPPPTGNY